MSAPNCWNSPKIPFYIVPGDNWNQLVSRRRNHTRGANEYSMASLLWQLYLPFKSAQTVHLVFWYSSIANREHVEGVLIHCSHSAEVVTSILSSPDQITHSTFSCRSISSTSDQVRYRLPTYSHWCPAFLFFAQPVSRVAPSPSLA